MFECQYLIVFSQRQLCKVNGGSNLKQHEVCDIDSDILLQLCTIRSKLSGKHCQGKTVIFWVWRQDWMELRQAREEISKIQPHPTSQILDLRILCSSASTITNKQCQTSVSESELQTSFQGSICLQTSIRWSRVQTSIIRRSRI